MFGTNSTATFGGFAGFGNTASNGTANLFGGTSLAAPSATTGAPSSLAAPSVNPPVAFGSTIAAPVATSASTFPSFGISTTLPSFETSAPAPTASAAPENPVKQSLFPTSGSASSTGFGFSTTSSTSSTAPPSSSNATAGKAQRTIAKKSYKEKFFEPRAATDAKEKINGGGLLSLRALQETIRDNWNNDSKVWNAEITKIRGMENKIEQLDRDGKETD